MFILHTESSCGWGGQEIRILEESRALIGRGHRVEIACPPESRLFPACARWGVPAIPWPIARRGWKALRAVRASIARLGPDVVNTHSSTDSWLVAVATRLMRNRPAIVRTRHISAAIGRGPLSRWLYASVPDRVVTTGESIRTAIIERAGADPGRVSSIPTGIDPERFRPGDPREARASLGLDPDRPLVGIVATLRSWKGHEHLIDAFASLPDWGWDLVIVGDGPQRANLEARIAAAGLADRARLVGHRDEPELWIRALDVVCQPSYANEGVPQAIVQAMMTGRAIVTTPAGAIAEAVEHGRTAVLVEPKDVPAIAAALGRLMGDPDARRRLGETARTEAMARFSLAAMADRMLEVFEAARR